MLMCIGLVLFMAAFIKVCAVHTPSSNPRKPAARKLSLPSSRLQNRPMSSRHHVCQHYDGHRFYTNLLDPHNWKILWLDLVKFRLFTVIFIFYSCSEIVQVRQYYTDTPPPTLPFLYFLVLPTLFCLVISTYFSFTKSIQPYNKCLNSFVVFSFYFKESTYFFKQNSPSNVASLKHFTSIYCRHLTPLSLFLSLKINILLNLMFCNICTALKFLQ